MTTYKMNDLDDTSDILKSIERLIAGLEKHYDAFLKVLGADLVEETGIFPSAKDFMARVDRCVETGGDLTQFIFNSHSKPSYQILIDHASSYVRCYINLKVLQTRNDLSDEVRRRDLNRFTRSCGYLQDDYAESFATVIGMFQRLHNASRKGGLQRAERYDYLKDFVLKQLQLRSLKRKWSSRAQAAREISESLMVYQKQVVEESNEKYREAQESFVANLERWNNQKKEREKAARASRGSIDLDVLQNRWMPGYDESWLQGMSVISRESLFPKRKQKPRPPVKEKLVLLAETNAKTTVERWLYKDDVLKEAANKVIRQRGGKKKVSDQTARM